MLRSVLPAHGLDGSPHWLHAHPEACSVHLDQTSGFLVPKPLFKAWALMLMVMLFHFLSVFMWQTDLDF